MECWPLANGRRGPLATGDRGGVSSLELRNTANSVRESTSSPFLPTQLRKLTQLRKAALSITSFTREVARKVRASFSELRVQPDLQTGKPRKASNARNVEIEGARKGARRKSIPRLIFQQMGGSQSAADSPESSIRRVCGYHFPFKSSRFVWEITIVDFLSQVRHGEFAGLITCVQFRASFR